MNINIYNNKSDPRKVNKNLQLLRENVNCQIFGNISIENPNFLIKLDSIIPDANYIYVPEWGRYYYAKIEIQEGGKAMIICHVDTLSSFFYSCGSSPVIARRSSSKPDYRIEDSRVLKLKEPKILVKNVGLNLPTISGYNYVLTLMGN